MSNIPATFIRKKPPAICFHCGNKGVALGTGDGWQCGSCYRDYDSLIQLNKMVLPEGWENLVPWKRSHWYNSHLLAILEDIEAGMDGELIAWKWGAGQFMFTKWKATLEGLIHGALSVSQLQEKEKAAAAKLGGELTPKRRYTKKAQVTGPEQVAARIDRPPEPIVIKITPQTKPAKVFAAAEHPLMAAFLPMLPPVKALSAESRKWLADGFSAIVNLIYGDAK